MQSINLYNIEFQPDRSPLQLGQITALVAVMLVLLLAYSLWYGAGNEAASRALNRAKAHTLELSKRRDKLAVIAQRASAGAVDTEIAAVHKRIAQRETIRTIMQRQNVGNAEGFSGQMRALARQAQKDIALQKFSLERGGHYLTLSGVTGKPEAVPRYLAKLHKEPAFAHTGVGVISLETDKAQHTLHRFSVMSASKKKAGHEPL